MEFEGKALRVPENAAAQLEEKSLADHRGLAREDEREKRREDCTRRVEASRAECGQRVALDEGGKTVVDAPREDRGPGHDCGLREHHHDGDQRDRGFLGCEKFPKKGE